MSKIDWEHRGESLSGGNLLAGWWLFCPLIKKAQIHLIDLFLFPPLVHKDMVEDPAMCLLKSGHVLFPTFLFSTSLIPCQKKMKLLLCNLINLCNTY